MIKKVLKKIYYKSQFLIFGQEKVKLQKELLCWKNCKQKEKDLSNTHYKYFYTKHFGISEGFYNRKKILDIGCGPRGSLEWAKMASCRIGLDPLVDSYRKIGIDKHNMQYIEGKAEKIPFPDEYFDVVSSFNSLDHVDNLDKTINEIIRVLRKRGYFLLLTDVNHDTTICEPISFSWDIAKRFLPRLELISEKHYEKFANGMYKSILDDIFYDHLNKAQRYGILSARFRKV